MRTLLCLKIGGGAITDKASRGSFDSSAAEQFADNLKSVADRQKTGSLSLILGNGAGSFGHQTAHEYGLRQGACSKKQWYGAAITHNAVRQLNYRVAEALTERGLPVFAVSPGDNLLAAAGEPRNEDPKVIRNILAGGATPLIHGDIVQDIKLGISIFSTEKSLLYYCRQLKADYDRVIFAAIARTGGVLDKDGRVIPVLGRNDQIDIIESLDHDTTGGITGKIASCREAAEITDAVYIIGNNDSDLAAITSGKDAGTRVL